MNTAFKLLQTGLWAKNPVLVILLRKQEKVLFSLKIGDSEVNEKKKKKKNLEKTILKSFKENLKTFPSDLATITTFLMSYLCS